MHEKKSQSLISALAVARLILFVTLCAFSWQSTSAPANEAAANKPSAPGRFENDIAEFEAWDQKNAWPRDAVLFMGSSSIRLWKTAKAFPELPVINRGFGGSTIADANHYFDRIVTKYKPRAIVFYSGDNDIAGGKSAERVFEDYLAFVEKTREQLPETPIYFISIKPSTARQKMWPEMKKVNALVEKLATTNSQVHYVDVAAPMLGSESVDRNVLPSKELFRDDGLHLNANGYKVWNNTLAPRLNEAFGKD
jgi:lysophospholipase L1-like esterase